MLKKATVGQKDQIGLAYIVKILALGDDIASHFVHIGQASQVKAYREVGLREAWIKEGGHVSSDFHGFWQRIGEIFPGIYTDDLPILKEDGAMKAVQRTLRLVETPFVEESLVLQTLATSIHLFSMSLTNK